MSQVMLQVGKLLEYAPFIMVLCFGIAEALKRFGVKGKASFGASLVVGAAFGILAYLAEFGQPADFAGWFAALAFGILLGLATSGIYDFATGRINTTELVLSVEDGDKAGEPGAPVQ